MQIISQLPIKQIITLVIITLVYAIIWLWQRQPQSALPLVPQEQATESAQQILPQGLTIALLDNQVINTKEIKIEGRASATSFVAIYSNSAQVVTKSDAAGNFAAPVVAEPGLNLIEITTIPQGSNRSLQKSLTLFFDQEESEVKTVFAGSVKSIFDTLLTLTTTTGDKNVRTSKTTEITIPEDEEESKNAQVKNIRIGDYAIALGNPPEGNTTDEDSIVGTSIQILRDIKPQNNVRVAPVQVITPVRQNLFSAKSQDQKIIELTLVKNSQIQTEDTVGKSTDIARDKSAIVFYHQEGDKNVVDLIYLLP